MPKKSSITGRRAWNILRLALLWARKGGVIVNLNVLQKGIRKLRHHQAPSPGALVYGDRQFSFDDTPIIHVKMHRPSSLRFKMPNIPCINPPVDFDYDFEFDRDDFGCVDDDRKVVDSVDRAVREEEENDQDCDEGIDVKAEEFIAMFYQQMKLQRQISYLQYNDRNSS